MADEELDDQFLEEDSGVRPEELGVGKATVVGGDSEAKDVLATLSHVLDDSDDEVDKMEGELQSAYQQSFAALYSDTTEAIKETQQMTTDLGVATTAPMEAFDLKEETEEGYFDQFMNYHSHKRVTVDSGEQIDMRSAEGMDKTGVDAFADKQMSEMTSNAVRVKHLAKWKQETEALQRTEDGADNGVDLLALWKTVHSLMREGESVQQSIVRLGAGLKRKKSRQRKRSLSEMKSDSAVDATAHCTAADEMKSGSAEQCQSQLERLNEAVHALFSDGDSDIYQLKRSALTERIRFTQVPFIEYIWLSDKCRKTHGPFDPSEMHQWALFGCFNENHIVFRTVGTQKWFRSDSVNLSTVFAET